MPLAQAELKREVNVGGKMETADTYLGLATKLLTIFAGLSTLAVWLYSQYYVGELVVKSEHPVDELTVKLYDERGQESVFHSAKMKVVPGHYQVIIEGDDAAPVRQETEVKFNATTVVPYVVRTAVLEKVVSHETHRRWWQFWKRGQ